jgi:hypothetical protein
MKYRSLQYAANIQAEVCEVAGHFDKVAIGHHQRYSLHTEYSYGPRRLDSELIGRFPLIASAARSGVPQLWHNTEWAIAFADFIHALVDGGNPPEVIEIHPPFDDYCGTSRQFLSIYARFEKRIGQLFPKSIILLENRYGNMYRGGKFLVSSHKDVADLIRELDDRCLNLGIALDVPQLVSQMGGVSALRDGSLEKMLSTLRPARHRIVGLHLWGTGTNPNTGRRRPHLGDLDSFFESNPTMKVPFLKELQDLLDDGRSRYFVPEVNGPRHPQSYLAAIVRDMQSVGFTFNGAR